LWAEEWEDDTEETDFAIQLRYVVQLGWKAYFREELEKVKEQNSGQKMQT
jgi:hypothetical protein